MDINNLLPGVIGAVIGAIFTTVASYIFQHRLLKKQLAAAEKTQAEFIAFLQEAKRYFEQRSKQVSSHLGNIDNSLQILSGNKKN